MKKLLSVLALFVLAGILVFSCSQDNRQAPVTGAVSVGKIADLQSNMDRVAAVLQKHNPRLFSNTDVVGTAIGLGDDGNPAVLVLTRVPGARGIPGTIDGVPVKVEITGEIRALVQPEGKGKPTPPTDKIDPTEYFTRPVPIGVSTGNAGECSAGTIGCRVIRGGNVYALSNNHVYALENDASTNSQIVQPGLYDTRCTLNSSNVVGKLSDSIPIDFSADGSNAVDAAIALCTAENLGKATPSNGYGTPGSTPRSPLVNLSVQKYGRSSGLTKGTIIGIDATVNVGYTHGTARFVHQIIVQSAGGFIKAGDSGSLLVTNNAGCNPVGLLFAGNKAGNYAFANQIGLVLSAFGVSIDGQ